MSNRGIRPSEDAGDNVIGEMSVTPGSAQAGSSDDGQVEAEPAVAARIFGMRLNVARAYVDSLATDGVLRGLIGPREPSRLWTRHVLNSAVIADLIDTGLRVVDIGSGAGLPGIPLAIARPDLQVALVEPLERRVRYLVQMVDELGLTGCRVVHGRAEDVVTQCGDADVVTSRAVAPLHRLVTWSTPLVRFGGVVLAMKGQSAAQELDRDRKALAAAGLVDPEVLELGSHDMIEPTYVIRARRVAGAVRENTNAGQRNRRARRS